VHFVNVEQDASDDFQKEPELEEEHSEESKRRKSRGMKVVGLRSRHSSTSSAKAEESASNAEQKEPNSVDTTIAWRGI
jgi:hypothetical protein